MFGFGPKSPRELEHKSDLLLEGLISLAKTHQVTTSDA